MSYQIKSQIAEDTDLMRRIAACAAAEGVLEYATTWAARYLWQIASTPGWDNKYAQALAAGNERPGTDEGVITDDMIRDAVRALLERIAQETAPGQMPENESEVE